MATRRDREDNKESPFAHMRSDWPKVPGANSNAPPTSATPELAALLAEHDKPHRHSAIEWWYINGHVDVQQTSADNPGFSKVTPMSFFAAFFRLHTAEEESLKVEDCDVTDQDRERILGQDRLYSLNWAVTDHSDHTYRPFSFVDVRTPKALLAMMKSGVWRGNDHLQTALKEVFTHGNVPAPDRLFSKVCHCHEDALDVSLQGCTFKAVPNGNRSTRGTFPHRYELHLEGSDEHGTINIDVTIDPSKQPVLHGRDGVVSVTADKPGPEDMFYYFYPRCSFKGSVTRSLPDGSKSRAERISGSSWYDHEFGGCVPESRAELQRAVVEPARERNGAEYTWEWAAVQLSNVDIELSAVRLKCGGGDTERLIDSFIVAREGSNPSYRIEANAMEFFADVDEKNSTGPAGGKFSSPRTSQEFTTQWRIRFKSPITGDAVDLKLDTETLDQEFVTLAAKPSFWEGHVRCRGAWGSNTAVAGDGYLECRGSVSGSLDQFFDIMHTLLCFPLKTVAPTLSGSMPNDFRGYIAKEIDSSLQGSPLAGMLDDASKTFIVSIGCAYVYTIKAGKNVRGRMLDWLEDRFIEHPHSRAPPFHLVLLRAFSLHEMDVAAGLLPEPAMCASQEQNRTGGGSGAAAAAAASSSSSAGGRNTDNNEEGCAPPPRAVHGDEAAALQRVAEKVGFQLAPFHVAADTELVRQPTAAEMEVVDKLYTGKWEMHRGRSEATSTLLSAQGVNIFIRALTDRLTPTLDTSVLQMPPTVITQVSTSLSKDESKTEIGREGKWFSKGRGELTSRSCLQDGGRTLYTRTFVPANQTKSVEHKWTRVEESREGNGGETRRCVEFYRFDPNGVLDKDSLYAGRLFLSQ